MVRKFDSDTLLLATHNQGKIVEISALLADYVANFPNASSAGLEEPEETGVTFAENAILKAEAAMKATGLPALADDSGLAVAALNGDPGIYSARWAIDEDGNKDFHMAMKTVHEAIGDNPDRSAAFVCALALAWPDGHVETFEGRCEGEIVWPPRGEHGHGYDPIFQPAGFDKTFAELTMDEKQALSHRGKALRMMFDACFVSAQKASS